MCFVLYAPDVNLKRTKLSHYVTAKKIHAARRISNFELKAGWKLYAD